MAKFLLEDGSIKSGDRIYDEMRIEEEMNNRQKLINTNMYDLLLKINNKIQTKNGMCILDMIEDKAVSCKKNMDCVNCIQEYLNRESK